MAPRCVPFEPSDQGQLTNLSRAQLTNLSGSDKTRLIPQGYTGPQAGERSTEYLAAFLLHAVAADKTKSRREITPPSRSGHEAYARRKGKHPLTTYARLKSCLRAVAVRALGDLTADGQQTPDAEELAEALEAFAWDNYGQVIHLREPGEPADALKGWTFVDADGVTNAARQAAERALGTLSWSPEGRAELQRRQSVGGTKGRRGPSTVTPENAARLAELEQRQPGLTVAQQAMRLRLAPATVKRLRRLQK